MADEDPLAPAAPIANVELKAAALQMARRLIDEARHPVALVSSWDDNYGTQGLLFAQSGSGNWAALPNKLSGTVSGMGDYVGSMSIALSADGHTPLLGSAGAGLNTPQGAWVFENGTRVISHVFVLMLENITRDFAGRVRILSMISPGDCAESASPDSGSWGCPMWAKRSRR